MTDREKMIEVIKQASEQAYADFHELFREGVKRVHNGEISRFTNRDVRPTHDEILADKLIEAGFGNIRDLKAELRSKLDYIHEQDDVIKDYKHRAELAEAFHNLKCKDYDLLNYQFEKMKHRAEVAEMALRQYTRKIGCECCPFYERCEVTILNAATDFQECFDEALRIAEKELAEEEKDDTE